MFRQSNISSAFGFWGVKHDLKLCSYGSCGMLRTYPWRRCLGCLCPWNQTWRSTKTAPTELLGVHRCVMMCVYIKKHDFGHMLRTGLDDIKRMRIM